MSESSSLALRTIDSVDASHLGLTNHVPNVTTTISVIRNDGEMIRAFDLVGNEPSIEVQKTSPLTEPNDGARVVTLSDFIVSEVDGIVDSMETTGEEGVSVTEPRLGFGFGFVGIPILENFLIVFSRFPTELVDGVSSLFLLLGYNVTIGRVYFGRITTRGFEVVQRIVGFLSRLVVGNNCLELTEANDDVTDTIFDLLILCHIIKYPILGVLSNQFGWITD